MQNPIAILKGNAGVGKDYVASRILQKEPTFTSIAMADPIKRLAKEIWDLPDNTLWGPSEERNKPVEGFRPKGDWPFISGKSKVLNLTYSLMESLEVRCPRVYRDVDPVATMLNYLNALEEYSKDNVVTCRYLLQTLGTTWGRNSIHSNIWIWNAIDVANKLLTGGYDYTAPAGVKIKDDKYYNAVIITDGRFRNEILTAKDIGCTIVNIIRNTNLSEQALKAGSFKHQSEVELDTIPSYWANYTINNDVWLEKDIESFIRHFKNS
jgi:hypothetical protein